MDNGVHKKHPYLAVVSACVAYVVPKVIDLLSHVTFWLLTHWL